MVGDKCIVLSKDFPDKEDEKLCEKWKTQLKNQYNEFHHKFDDEKDDPMDGTTTGQNYGRLMRKSIPPPLPMFGGAPEQNLLSISQANGPIQQRLTSESDTPLTSTISAPAEAYRMKSSFSLTTPNEPISAPAAMDDLTVEAASRKASNMEGIPEERKTGNPQSSTVPKTSEPGNFYLDFSI
uniref:Uncharacterized protein n=1 Tax=Panagrolaimus sp. JU765 TaxID=591449 RepID=A0AC34R144_9BILA